LHNYNYDDFINAASFIESNYRKYPFEELIEIEFTLDNIDEAFSFAEKYKPVRVGIKNKSVKNPLQKIQLRFRSPIFLLPIGNNAIIIS